MTGGWGCPHEVNDLCSKLNNLPCDPGMKGCVLAGRYVFANENKNKRLREKQARVTMAVSHAPPEPGFFAIGEWCMEMKGISSGKLRAIGYDAQRQRLRVQFDDGTMLEYDGVGAEIWRRLDAASSPWSVYRDNVEEEYVGRRVTTAGVAAGSRNNPLDNLFR